MLQKISIETLLQMAKQIPSLGKGGKSIHKDLIHFAKKIDENEAIVDLGCFLGSTTAFCAIGANLANSPCKIIAYDKFESTIEYINKSNKHLNIELPTPSFKGKFLHNIKPFIKDSKIDFSVHAVDIINLKYPYKNKIYMVVDDICNTPPLLNKMMSALLPFFIPKRTLIFAMDYYFYEDNKSIDYQKEFYEFNSKNFRFIKRIEDSKTAVFKYMGGRPKYLRTNFNILRAINIGKKYVPIS